ncbi:MAG: hypothetical protein ACOYMS_06035 [Terrimicrobiaceae bacterium]
MDEFNEKDTLWDLLGRAKPVKASPYFVRKVLREVKESGRPGHRRSAFLRWLIPTSAFAAVVMGWTAYQWQHEQSVAEFNEYFDTIADLPSLVAQEDVSIWAETN